MQAIAHTLMQLASGCGHIVGLSREQAAAMQLHCKNKWVAMTHFLGSMVG